VTIFLSTISDKQINPHPVCKEMSKAFSQEDIDRIIEMAWEDRTPFDAIEIQFGIAEKEVIALMRRNMLPSSFRMWRKRVQGRSTKHSAKRVFLEGRFKCSRQSGIAGNKIAKR
jgi:uncharacterized protein (TIGR03643 family)